MHDDSDTCLHVFLPTSEFSALLCQFKEKLKVLSEDCGPMQCVFGLYLRVRTSLYQRARNIFSTLSFVLMRKCHWFDVENIGH